MITIPPYFTQIERLAVTYAAKLAGFNVLQLLNDNTAGRHIVRFHLWVMQISVCSGHQLRGIPEKGDEFLHPAHYAV